MLETSLKKTDEATSTSRIHQETQITTSSDITPGTPFLPSDLVKAKPEALTTPKQRCIAIWYLLKLFFLGKFFLWKICWQIFPVWDLNVRTLPTLRAARRRLRRGWRVRGPQLPDVAAYLCESNMRWTGVWCNNNMKKQHCHPSDLDHFQGNLQDPKWPPKWTMLQLLLQFAMVQAVWCFQSRGFVERLPPGHAPDIVVAYSITNVTFRILSEYSSFDNWQVHNLSRVYLPLYQIISIIWMSVRIFLSLSVCLRSCTLSTSAPLCINLINLSLCLPVDLGACLSVIYHALRLPACYFLSLPFLLARLAFFVRVLCAFLNPHMTVCQNFSKSVKV